MPEVVRNLTTGEMRYAIEIFGGSIEYRKVLIHNTRWFMFQPSDTAMTPNGEIYFPEQRYKPDFSINVSDAAWLIHEITHAWQYQQGMSVIMRAALDRNYHYGDLHASQQIFTEYGLEQQAAIVEDYFRLNHSMRAHNGRGSIEDYQRVIPFLPGVKR